MYRLNPQEKPLPPTERGNVNGEWQWTHAVFVYRSICAHLNIDNKRAFFGEKEILLSFQLKLYERH